MVKPRAVLISDVHYNINTLQLADAAMRQAVDKANELKVPLVVAGDLHDTKANMRAECVNAMIKTFKSCKVPCYILRGNHDAINEKSEEHALNFLDTFTIEQSEDEDHYNYIMVWDVPGLTNDIAVNSMSVHLIPYHSDPDKLREYLKKVDKGSTIIMHQGLQGSNSGEYFQDKSALTHDDVKDFRVISGHYHQRQTIKTGRPQKGAVGLWSYIGNPFTLNFGEANDPEKGFQILMSDGMLEFVSTKLRRHAILNLEKLPNDYWQITGKVPVEDMRPQDLVLARVRGTREQLSDVTHDKIAKVLGINSFRLELIQTPDSSTPDRQNSNKSNPEILDSIIDAKDLEDNTKVRVKELWRNLCE